MPAPPPVTALRSFAPPALESTRLPPGSRVRRPWLSRCAVSCGGHAGIDDDFGRLAASLISALLRRDSSKGASHLTWRADAARSDFTRTPLNPHASLRDPIFRGLIQRVLNLAERVGRVCAALEIGRNAGRGCPWIP